MSNTTQTTPQVKVVKVRYSDIDEKNRQFIWFSYEDGSARSVEVIHWTGVESEPTKKNWEAFHPSGSMEAEMLHAMP